MAPGGGAATEVAVRVAGHVAKVVVAKAGVQPGWGGRGPVATLVNELIDALRPTVQSDRRRRAVFQHITQLVNGCFASDNVLVRRVNSRFPRFARAQTTEDPPTRPI